MPGLVLIASVTFFSSLAGLVALFSFKGLEERRGYAVLPRAHAWLDAFALRLKDLLMYAQLFIAAVPPLVALLSRLLFASGARAFARVAQRWAESAHGLADFVSHKRNFERKPVRSEFLRKIEEHKNEQNREKESAQPDVDL